jgi:hypothetical protein
MTGSRSADKKRTTSPEVAGGAGFTYADNVAAYYLAALLREERAAGLDGVVTSVAVEQAGTGNPMDDVVVESGDNGLQGTLGLQVKRRVQIGGGARNKDFGDVMRRAVEARASEGFNADRDRYGFVTEHVAAERFRSLTRLIGFARNPTGEDFERHVAASGAPERELRDELAPLIRAKSLDDERSFYAQLVALHMDGVDDGGVWRTEVVNRLQELVAGNEDGQDLLLFDRLCRIVREGAGSARKWTRQTLLSQLRGVVRLKVAPSYESDIRLLHEHSVASLGDVSEEVAGFRVSRPALEGKIREALDKYRLTNLSGLPGSGKSAMLKRMASADAAQGPILLLKSDRLMGTGWASFAAALGLRHRDAAALLAEIGSAGTAVLYIDGIDRIRPDQKGIVTDILRAIESNAGLANWKVVATSRDQGLEAYRAWFLASFYRQTGVRDVQVDAFSEEEAEALAKEHSGLRGLLFGSQGVRDIARRPFFAAVLAASFPDGSEAPQTEVDLISAWWSRAGHDAPVQAAPERQRALLDLAEKGVRNLGKNVPARSLKEATFARVAELKADWVIRDQDDGATYSFTHDIFFEWVFFRHLIELGGDWTQALKDAGEPPLLGRVVGLLAQRALAVPGRWTAGYRDLAARELRPQWRREWLTAPPFSPAFEQGRAEFQALLVDHALFEKLLVWFQAQHTIPNPTVVANAAVVGEGVDRVRVAHLWGWPSDFRSWARLLDWMIPLIPELPARLLPDVAEIFGVWQNALAGMKNPRSEAIVTLCAGWLVDLEELEYPVGRKWNAPPDDARWQGLSGDGQTTLAAALRMTVVQSARAYPAPAIALFERASVNTYMRRKLYGELMGFSPTMAGIAPEALVALAKAQLIEELPRDRVEREERERKEHFERIEKLRAIPEKDRTEEQKRELLFQHASITIGHWEPDIHDIGIESHQHYYSSLSPLHEPFASLFAAKPELALGLVRDLANHATRGWRQVELFHRERWGTPLPIIVEFSWGKQEFWGDNRVYGWMMGFHAPNALECAIQALGYWAFKEVERGRPADEVIRAVVEGSECYAMLGLALVIALEAGDASETTFPIVTCQRLWTDDIHRVIQAPTRNFDLMGIGALRPPSAEKAQAKAFLDARLGRKGDVRELAMRFALTTDGALQQRFKGALARFPKELPYQVEEQRSNAATTASLREDAERWAGIGDVQNYRGQRTADNKLLIGYQPPTRMTPAQEKRLAESTATLQEFNVIGWATKCLDARALADGMSLADAVAFARARDKDDVFAERRDGVEDRAQSVISSVAAVVIRVGSPSDADLRWAWDIMERIAHMRNLTERMEGGVAGREPVNHLILALVHDRQAAAPRDSSLRQLLELTLHGENKIAHLAFQGLFLDPDEHVRWVATQLALDLSLHHRPAIKRNGERDSTRGRQARRQSLARALGRLEKRDTEPLGSLPPAWVKGAEGSRRRGRVAGA